MALSGAGMLGMARMGLSSFGQGRGDLFGNWGRMAANPLAAVKSFLRKGNEILKHADTGASSTSMRTLMATARSQADDDLDEAVRNIAEKHTERREKIRNLSRTLTQAEIETSIEQALTDVRTQSDAQVRTEEGMMRVRGGERDLGVSSGPAQREFRQRPGQAPYEMAPNRMLTVTESGHAEQITSPIGPSRVARLEPMGADIERVSSAQRRQRRLEELGREGEGQYQTLMDEANRPHEAFSQAKTQHGSVRNAQQAFIKQMGVDIPERGVSEKLLQDAWRQYKQRYPFQDLPMRNPSKKELEEFAVKSDYYLREVEKRVEREYGSSGQRLTSFGEAESYRGAPIGMSGPQYADPVAQGLYDDVDIDAFTVTGLESGDQMKMSDLLYHDRRGGVNTKKGLADKLAKQVKNKFDWLESQAEDVNVETSFEKIRVDQYHQAFHGEIQIGDQSRTFRIPLPSEHGTYKRRRGQTPIVSSPQKLFENDLFADTTSMELLRETRSNMVARPDELSLMSISNYVTKMLNDIEGGRGPEAIVSFIERERQEFFNKQSQVTDSVPDTITKATQVRDRAEMFFDAVANTDRRQNIEQGVESAEKIRQIFDTGTNYFASDSEFVSPEMRGEAGQSGRAQLAYEIGGQIMKPGKDEALAEIEYHPNLFKDVPEGEEAQKYMEEIRQSIRDFQSQHTDRSADQIDQMIEKMEQGGEMRVTVGNDSYDLLDPNQETPDFIPERGEAESVREYYTRAQSALLDEFDAEFSVGQNFISSEHSIYSRLYENSDVDMPTALKKSNVIDMMNLAHVLGANPAHSRSLSNIGSVLYGLEGREFMSAMKAGVKEVKRARQAGGVLSEPDMIIDSAMKEARKAAIQSGGKQAAKKGDDFWRGFAEDLTHLPDEFSLHTAESDAILTGAFAARRMNKRIRETEGQIAIERAEAALKESEQVAGDRRFVEGYGGLRHRGQDETGDEKGLNPFLQNQESATMGAGSMLHSNVLPFARLQNPVRQLYQRNKPRRLISQPDQTGVGGMNVGDEWLPMRPRKPDGKMKKLLNQEARMKLFRKGEGVVEYDGPALFAGYGTSTPEQRQLRGGRANEMQYGVTSRVAMVPRNTIRTWESQAQGTAARRQALMGGMTVHKERKQIDRGQIDEGQMENWIQRKARDMGIDVTKESDVQPTDQPRAKTHREILQEVYVLQQMFDDKKGTASEEFKTLINRAIEEREAIIRDGAKGKTPLSDKVRQAIQEVESGKNLGKESRAVPVVGENKELYDPHGDQGIIKNPLLGPSNPEAIGIDVGVRLKDDGSGSVELRHIEHPGNVIKTQTGATKVSSASPVPDSSVGAFGEQAVMEAAFEKIKRRDFAGYVRAQVERIHRKVNEELQYLAREKGPSSLAKERQDVIDRAARALSKLTKSMSESDIKRQVLNDKLYADYVEFDYTDEFVREAEEANLNKMMDAAQEAGLTVRSTMKMAMEADGQTPGDVAKHMEDQLDKIIEGLKEQKSNVPDGVEEQAHRQQINSAIGRLEKKKEAISGLGLHDGKIPDLNQDAFNDGSLFDFFIANDGQMTTAYQVLSPEERPQNPATGGSRVGDDFEAGVGRATKRKRSSLLSSALMGHSMQQTPGGTTGPEGALFQAYLGAKSGAGALSSKKLRREIARELQKKGISNPKLDAEHVQWDEENGEFVYLHPTEGKIRLDGVNPFATLTQRVRNRVGVVGMISGEIQTESVAGQQIGDESRVLDLRPDSKGNLLAEGVPMHKRYGKLARKRMHREHVEGKDPTDVRPEDAESFDNPKVYFGKGERPGDSPIFNERYDFVKVDLHAGMDDLEANKVADMLREAGLNEGKIGRALAGGEHFIKSALTSDLDDPAEKERVRALVDHIRGPAEESGPFSSAMLMQTRTGGNRPEPGPHGGYSIGSRFSNLIESSEAVTTIQESISRIEQKAKEVDTDTMAGKKELKRFVEEEVQKTHREGAFQEVEKLFSNTLRKAVNQVSQQMEGVTGRYMGGEYSIAAPQTQTLDNFKQLAEAADFGPEGGPSSIEDQVREMMKKSSKPYMQEHSAGRFEDMVQGAAEDLYTYMKQQKDRHGSNLHEWQGFGVGEGFLSRSKARPMLRQMEVSHKNMDFEQMQEQFDKLPGEPTNAQSRAKDDLRSLEEGSELEKRLARQEIESPGSTPGIIMMNARQPDFTMAVGYETGRATVMGDEALRAIGMDPDEVHMFSNPLTSWSRKEDFDFDLNYLATINNSAVAHQMRRTRARGMPEQVALLHQVVEGRAEGANMTREGPASSYEKHSDTYTIGEQGGGPQGQGRAKENIVETRRVTTNFITQNETFDDPMAQHFGSTMQAVKAAMSGKEAREAYALQQSIVGQFGAYAKQGAVRTMQRENSFMDLMGRMIQAADVEAKDSPEAKKRAAKAKAVFQDIRLPAGMEGNAETPGTIEKSVSGWDSSWEFMKQTVKEVEEARQSVGDTTVFDPLHTAALAEGQIAQEVAIEKYKDGDPQRRARKMNSILQTLHGNHTGGYNSFDQAMDDLMDEEAMGAKIQDYFRTPDEPMYDDASAEMQAQMEKRARNAFRLQYNMNQAMKMAGQVGLTDSYLSHNANVPTSDVPRSQQLAQISDSVFASQGGRDLQAELPAAVEREILGEEAQSAYRNFVAAEHMTTSQLDSILNTPATFQERATQMVRDLPASVKGLGIAAGAGLAVLGAMDGPKNIADGETYDLPQPDYQRGTEQTTLQAARGMEQKRREAQFYGRRRPTVGQSYRTRRPPTVEANY